MPAKLAKDLSVKVMPENHCSCDLSSVHKEGLYGDFWCHLVANSPRNVHLTLNNADSYKYLALAAYLSQGEWEFSRGRAKPKKRQKVEHFDPDQDSSDSCEQGTHKSENNIQKTESNQNGTPADSDIEHEDEGDEALDSNEDEEEDDKPCTTSLRSRLRNYFDSTIAKLRCEKPCTPPNRPREGTSAQDNPPDISARSLAENDQSGTDARAVPGAWSESAAGEIASS